MAVSSSVRNISVISTGSAAGHPEHIYGTRKPSLWWLLMSKQWVPMPINVFVIEHDDGLVLFDTGVEPAAATDPDYYPDPITRWFVGRVFRFDISPEDNLAHQLEIAGFEASDVTKAVLSHLHFDHVGGIGHIPQAELLVSPDSWELLLKPRPEREYVFRRHLLVPGAQWKVMDFEPTDDPSLAPFTEACDVMGDGSLVVVPTPGHLPGSVSMLIRRSDGPPVLLIGDLTYNQELLERDQVAGTGDKKLLIQSYAKVRAMKQHTPDLVIVAAHDATAADKLTPTDGEGRSTASIRSGSTNRRR